MSALLTVSGNEPAKAKIATRWRELHGANNWAGLLSPLDLDLRREILRYGDATQATYDAFPLETKSMYPFACPYKKSEMFSKVSKPVAGYEVTRYLYANLRGFKTEIQEVNWIGYVAVTVDPEEIKRLGRRDIIVAWRGTRTPAEWRNDLLFRQIPPTSINGNPVPKGVEVSRGFWGAFADYDPSKAVFGVKGSAGKQATQEVKRLLEKYAGEQMSITCVGHSLGGALATLCAYQIAEDQIHKTPSGIIAPVTAFTFASTRVGNTAFRERMESLGVKVLRVKSKQDIVPCYPLGKDTDNQDILESVKQDVKQSAETTPFRDLLGFFVRKLKQAIKPDEYTHVGESLAVDFTKSPFLKQPKFIDLDIIETLGSYHNLDVYLHLVNGIVGTKDDEKMPFKPVVIRDMALINKSSDLLTDPSGKNVPANWWKQSNAGLVQNKEGFWVCVSNFDDPKAPNPDFD